MSVCGALPLNDHRNQWPHKQRQASGRHQSRIIVLGSRRFAAVIDGPISATFALLVLEPETVLSNLFLSEYYWPLTLSAMRLAVFAWVCLLVACSRAQSFNSEVVAHAIDNVRVMLFDFMGPTLQLFLILSHGGQTDKASLQRMLVPLVRCRCPNVECSCID